MLFGVMVLHDAGSVSTGPSIDDGFSPAQKHRHDDVTDIKSGESIWRHSMSHAPLTVTSFEPSAPVDVRSSKIATAESYSPPPTLVGHMIHQETA